MSERNARYSATTDLIKRGSASVSVIIPTYNSSRFLRESLDSVISQTLAPLEIIIVDDGSTDGTRDLVSQYADSRIRYVYQENCGASAARNRGLNLARGDLIAFLDGDDYWYPTMLEEQVRVMESLPNVVCCFVNFVRYRQSTGEFLPDQFNYYPELRRCLVLPSAIDGIFVVQRNPFVEFVGYGEVPAYTQAMIFRASALNGIRFDPTLRICEDLEWVLRVFERGGVAYNPKVLAVVRRHESNLTYAVSDIAGRKLAAFSTLLAKISHPEHRAALVERLIKAHIDASVALIRQRRFAAAIHVYLQCFSFDGGIRRKARGFIRILYTIFASTRYPS